MPLEEDILLINLNYYNQMQEQGKKYIPDTAVTKVILLDFYNKFVNDKSLIPIEKLPIEKKKELAAQCRATGNFYTNETLIEQCKILYLLKSINETKTTNKRPLY